MEQTIAEALREQGWLEGWLESWVEGWVEGKQLTLLLDLRRKFGRKVTKAVVANIQKTEDHATLDEWLFNTLEAKTLNEVGIPLRSLGANEKKRTTEGDMPAIIRNADAKGRVTLPGFAKATVVLKAVGPDEYRVLKRAELTADDLYFPDEEMSIRLSVRDARRLVAALSNSSRPSPAARRAAKQLRQACASLVGPPMRIDHE